MCFVSWWQNIYNQGGRYFWIHNVGPIGCLAYVIEWFPIKASDFDSHECASPLNNLAQQFNHALKQAVIELRAFLSEAAITYVDVYSAKHELFVHAQGHGFKRSCVSCCGHGGKYNYNKHIWCGKKEIVKGEETYIGKPCDEPDKAVVWDGVHLTQAANKFIFDKIVTGLSMACHRQWQEQERSFFFFLWVCSQTEIHVFLVVTDMNLLRMQ